LQQDLNALELNFQEEVNEYTEKMDVRNESFEQISLLPLKKDITVEFFTFIWIPAWQIKGESIQYA